jgi:hypothetical protein
MIVEQLQAVYERRLAEVDDQAPIQIRKPDRPRIAQVPARRRLRLIARTDGPDETDALNRQFAKLGSARCGGESDVCDGSQKACPMELRHLWFSPAAARWNGVFLFKAAGTVPVPSARITAFWQRVTALGECLLPFQNTFSVGKQGFIVLDASGTVNNQFADFRRLFQRRLVDSFSAAGHRWDA